MDKNLKLYNSLIKNIGTQLKKTINENYTKMPAHSENEWNGVMDNLDDVYKGLLNCKRNTSESDYNNVMNLFQELLGECESLFTKRDKLIEYLNNRLDSIDIFDNFCRFCREYRDNKDEIDNYLFCFPQFG